MVVLGQNGFYRKRVVVFGLSVCIRPKLLYSWKSGCNWAKMDVFGQNGCIRAEVVVFGQKWLYLG